MVWMSLVTKDSCHNAGAWSTIVIGGGVVRPWRVRHWRSLSGHWGNALGRKEGGFPGTW